MDVGILAGLRMASSTASDNDIAPSTSAKANHKPIDVDKPIGRRGKHIHRPTQKLKSLTFFPIDYNSLCGPIADDF